MICLTESAYACAYEPEKGRRVPRIIKEVGKIESKKGEVVGSVDAGIYASEEPLVVVEYPLSNGSIMGKGVSVVVWTEYSCLRCVDVVALVELALEIGQSNHQSQIVPYVASLQLQGLSHKVRGTDPGSRGFAAFDAENSFAFESIEILGEAAAISVEVVPFDGKHEKGIELIKGI